MKRFYRSLVQSLRAPKPASCGLRHATPKPMAECLESRTLMAADLSGAMINKFGGGTSAGYQPGIITAAGGGANGASSSGDSDDKITTAKSRSLNFTSDSEISSDLDVDLFKFTAKQGQRVTFDLDRPALSTLDSVLRLFNSAGLEIAISDDDPSPTEPNSLESYIDYTFGTTGTYYIGVSGAFNDGYNAVTGAGDVKGSTGKYKLIAQKYVNPDGDDTIGSAHRELTRNDSVDGRISFPLDIDIRSIDVDAGDTIAFDIDTDLFLPFDPQVDSVLRLFDDNGVQLAINDDGDDPTEVAEGGGQSYLEYTFLESGTYYIGVSGAGNDTYNAITGAGKQPGSVGRYILYTTLL